MNESRRPAGDLNVPAVASLWVALAGFGLPVAMPLAIAGWEPGSVGLIALLLGIIGIVQTVRRPRRKQDRPYAAAGVVLGCVLVIMCACGFFDYSHPAPTSACSNNLHRLGTGTHLYMQEHKGKFPPVESWNSAVLKYSKHESILYCPEADKSMPSYAMNRRLSGLTIEDVVDSSTTVMLFESVPGRNLFGGPALFPSPARHDMEGPHYGVVFCDGYAKMVDEKDLGKLNWDPKKGDPIH